VARAVTPGRVCGERRKEVDEMNSLIPITRTAGGALFAPPAPINADGVSPDVITRLNLHLFHLDRVGLGNLMLDVLFGRPGRERQPDADALFLNAALPHVLARLYDVPVQLMAEEGYPRPYLDRHVAAHDRDTWERGRFGFLVGVAFALGASRENLLGRHQALVPFYRDVVGREQRAALEAYAAEWKRNKPRVEADARALAPPPPALADPRHRRCGHCQLVYPSSVPRCPRPGCGRADLQLEVPA
jgi:hypothetical protein